MPLVELVCRKCGKTFQRQSKLARPDDRCQECEAKRQRPRQRTASGRYAIAKYIAKIRKIAFLLTREEFESLVTKPCHYCGWPNSETGIGLDRIDDAVRAYRADNVVPCCKECNLVKGSMFTFEEMAYFLGKAVDAVKRRRQKLGEPTSSLTGFGSGRKRKYA